MRVQFLLIGEGNIERGLVEHLASLCIAAGASEASGAVPPFERLKSFKQSIGSRSRQLLEELPLGGPLEQLAAWRHLRDDTAAAIAALRITQEAQP